MAKFIRIGGIGVTNEKYEIDKGPCIYHGFRLGMDGTNDVTLTLTHGYNGDEFVPTNKYKATSLGLNGEVLPDKAAIDCPKGIWAVVTCTGTFELVVIYSNFL